MPTTGTRVSIALDNAVEEMGRRLADNPQRLRAVLLDELGSEAREHRAEVEAIVAAATQEVPSALARRRRGEHAPADAELAQLVRSQGTTDDLAGFAVAAWSSALRLDGMSSLSTTAASGPVPSGPVLNGPAVSGPAVSGPVLSGVTVAAERSDETHVVAGTGLTGGAGATAGVTPTSGPTPFPAPISTPAPTPAAGAGPTPASGSGPTPSELVFGGATAAGTPPAGPPAAPGQPGPPDGGSRSRRGGIVLAWWMLVGVGALVVLLVGAIGWFAYSAGSDSGTAAGAGASAASTTAKTASKASTSASTTAATPSASATTTPTPTPTPVALTASDVVEPTFTPVLVDASTKSWQPVTMAITSTGTWDKIEIVGLVEQHGTVNVGADGMVDGTTLTYQPKHNGYFVDHILFKLHDTATGEVSNQATITINTNCDTTITAFPCVHHGPGDVMTGM